MNNPEVTLLNVQTAGSERAVRIQTSFNPDTAYATLLSGVSSDLSKFFPAAVPRAHSDVPL
jgi:hypothetical protein